MLVVDLRDEGSPTHIISENKPILSISLDQNIFNNKAKPPHTKRKTRENRESRRNKATTDFDSDHTKESAHFADDNSNIDIKPSQTYDIQSYRNAERSTSKNRETMNESSNIVMIESLVEDRLKQTNDLINEAINALKLDRTPTVSEANISKIANLDNEKFFMNEPDGISDIITPQRETIKVMPQLNEIETHFNDKNFAPIQDVTPTALSDARLREKYTSPIRTEYENMLVRNANESTKIQNQSKISNIESQYINNTQSQKSDSNEKPLKKQSEEKTLKKVTQSSQRNDSANQSKNKNYSKIPNISMKKSPTEKQ